MSILMFSEMQRVCRA